jgi:hypothetical protein
MAEELEELFVRRVDVGIADMDASTEDGVVSTRVVVERATATDRRTGQDRQLLLILGAEEAGLLGDVLQKASARATTEPA